MVFGANPDLEHNQRLEPYNELFKDNEWAYFLISRINLSQEKDLNISILLSSNIKKGPLTTVVTYLRKNFSETYPKAVEGLVFKQNTTKVELISLIIEFVRLTQPQLCLTCNSDYFPYSQEERENESAQIKCYFCEMPSHIDCVDDTTVDEKRGIIFLCQNCIQRKKENIIKKLCTPSPSSPESSPIQAAQKQRSTSPRSTSEEYESPRLLTTDSSDSESEKTKKTKKTAKKSKIKRTPKPKSGSDGSSSEEPESKKKETVKKPKSNQKDSRICHFYERGICRYGVSGTRDGKCKFSHPQICKRIISYGPKSSYGCKGDCEKWHPKLCYNSINKKECLKEYCGFWHIKGTTRSKTESEENPTKHDTKSDAKSENPKDKSGSFLESIQSHVTQMMNQQQSMLKQEMLQIAQCMTLMQNQIQSLSARPQNHPFIPAQNPVQIPVFQQQRINPTPPVVINSQA